MGILLMIVGYGWAFLGFMNFIIGDFSELSENMIAFAVILNVGIYFAPGLIVGGIGTMIHRKKKSKDSTKAAIIQCPNCAEDIKRAAKVCRFCGVEVIEPGSKLFT